MLVDPGHNGANSRHPAETGRLVDAGGFAKPCNSTGTTSVTGVSESATNLSLARELGRQLTALGAMVAYTRTDDAGWDRASTTVAALRAAPAPRSRCPCMRTAPRTARGGGST